MNDLELRNLDMVNGDVVQSIRINNYILDNNKFQNKNKCRVEFGIMGGSAVSHTSSNMIDIENELKGLSRVNSKCKDFNYMPPNNNLLKTKNNIKNVPDLNLKMKHLKNCNFFEEEPKLPMFSEPPLKFNKC